MEQSNKSSSSKPPIVGVVLTRKLIKNTLFSQNSIHRVRELVEANKIVKTNLLFFSKGDVNITKQKVLGAYYNDNENKWEFKIFPLPDVVYVRGGSGKRLRKLIRRFDDIGVKKINPIIAFNKGKLYQDLIQDQKVSPYLPATESVESMDEIMEMIHKLRKVYIKARRGRKGMQVMRVEKLSGNRYLYSYSYLGKLVRKRVNSMKSLEKVLNDFFGDKKVIVQKAIDLARRGRNRLCDFRAELQRNKTGEIEIVGVSIRVGQKNSPITTHANAYRYDTYLKQLFPHYYQQKINALKTKIQTFLLDVYAGVEKTYGKFGEIGIDFAVDRSGRVWLIECNAQSAKVSLGKAYGELARKAYVNPLEYAKLITNYKSSGTSNRSSRLSNSSSGTSNRSRGTSHRSGRSFHRSRGTSHGSGRSFHRSRGTSHGSGRSFHRSSGKRTNRSSHHRSNHRSSGLSHVSSILYRSLSIRRSRKQ